MELDLAAATINLVPNSENLITETEMEQALKNTGNKATGTD